MEYEPPVMSDDAILIELANGKPDKEKATKEASDGTAQLWRIELDDNDGRCLYIVKHNGVVKGRWLCWRRAWQQYYLLLTKSVDRIKRI